MCTQKYNIQHSYKVLNRKGIGGNKGNINKITKTTKPLIQYDLNGNFIKVWASKENASRELKIDSATISNCCRGKRNSAGSYKWKYVQNEIPRLNLVIDLMATFIDAQNTRMLEDEYTAIKNIYTIIGFDKDKEEIKQYFERKATNNG